MAGARKDERRVHAEYGCVRKLEQWDQKWAEDTLALSDPLDHVVQVGYAEEERADEDRLVDGVVAQEYGHHARPKHKGVYILSK